MRKPNYLRKLVCEVCDREFIAQHSAKTCGPRCRKRLQRYGKHDHRESTYKDDFTDDTKKGYVYVIAGETGFVKIGLSVDPAKRLERIQCWSPLKLNVISSVFVENMYEAEKALHRRFSENRVWGEWFDITPNQAITALEDYVKEV